MKRIKIAVIIGTALIFGSIGSLIVLNNPRKGSDSRFPDTHTNPVLLDTLFYEDGKIREIGSFLHDTVPHGVFRSYYPNGNLKSIAEFVEGKIEGVRKNFREDGTLISEIEYRNNKYDGLSTFYYENGNVEQEVHHFGGREFGPARFYYENGIQESLFFRDYLNDVYYIKRWDSTGEIIAEEGSVVSPNILLVDSTSKTGFSVGIISAIQLPGYSTRIYRIENDHLIPVDIKDYQGKIVFDSTIMHMIRLIGELYQNGRLYYSDTVLAIPNTNEVSEHTHQ